MTMREMVLNHASVAARDRHAAVDFLKSVACGMGQVIDARAAESSLRLARDSTEIECAPGFSLFDALEQLRQSGAREEYGLFAGAAAKKPLLSGLEKDVEHRFMTCQTRGLPPADGNPLLLCALQDWIAVGFPTEGEWDRDRLTVRFEELLPDDTYSEESEGIDHLARAKHAESICSRHRKRIHAGLTQSDFWRNRQRAFPNLLFGPDVQDQLGGVPYFRTVINRLIELDEAAGDWRRVGGREPSWRCKVTNESENVRERNPKLREARRFRSCSGGSELFFLHARYGSGGRIHLRLLTENREVEIGYIGHHLPL